MKFSDLKTFLAAVLTFFRNIYSAIVAGKPILEGVKEKIAALSD